MEEKATRQALARTAADGWISPERHGRRTRWLLTPDGDRLLTEGTERIYAFASSQRDWDGSWLLVLARVPETDRPTRHLLRTRLSWAGLGSAAPSVWITTHTERQAEVEQVLGQTGVTAGQIFVARHHGGGELAALVAEAWDLPAIEQRYEEFLAEFASAAAADPLTRLIELVHAWRRFPSIDPGLPARLLPAGWSGARAAKLFAARHAKWSPEAVMQWIRLNKAAGETVRPIARSLPARSVVPVEPCWWPGGGDLLAEPQEHDFESVGIVHCDAVDFRVAMPLVRHLLPGQEFLGAVQFGGITRTPEDTRYPGFAHLVPGGRADLPDHQRVGEGPVAVQYRQPAVVPHNLQPQHVTVERQRAVQVTSLQVDTEEPGRL